MICNIVVKELQAGQVFLDYSILKRRWKEFADNESCLGTVAAIFLLEQQDGVKNDCNFNEIDRLFPSVRYLSQYMLKNIILLLGAAASHFLLLIILSEEYFLHNGLEVYRLIRDEFQRSSFSF